MTWLRRALLPVLVALLAFAVGIALGTGPLRGQDDRDKVADLQRDNQQLTDETTSLRSAAAFDQGIGAALAPRLLQDRLKGRTVTMVVLPGVQSALVASTRHALDTSGADVAVLVRLADDLLDPGRKTYVDSVSASSVKGASDLADQADAGTYERVGALLARAYAGRGSDTTVDDEATTIDSELQGAKLVRLAGEALRRGSFVVVLAPGTHGADQVTAARVVIATDIVSAMTAGSDALVVGSTPTSSLPGGLIAALGEDEFFANKRFATVNVAGSAAGSITLVYALVAAATGSPGSYGVSAAAASGSAGPSAPEVELPPGLAAHAE